MIKKEDIPPIDIEEGKNQYGDINVFLSMMSNFEGMTLNKNLSLMKIAMDREDWNEVASEAHSRKGASAFLCAKRLYKICENIEVASLQEDIPKISDNYALLIKECFRIKHFIRNYFPETNSLVKQKRLSKTMNQILRFQLLKNIK